MPWKRKGFLLGLALVLALALSLGLYFYFSYDRNGMPRLPIVDLFENRFASKWDQQTGTAFVRPLQKSDVEKLELYPLPNGQTTPEALAAEGWTKVQGSGEFFLESLFSLDIKNALQIITAGNWIVRMDGRGEFYFMDARRDSDAKVRTNVWFVKQGLLRVKPHDYDPADHWMEVFTPKARIILHQAEVGIRIHGPGGDGQVWSMKGAVTVERRDGKVSVLAPKNMEYL